MERDSVSVASVLKSSFSSVCFLQLLSDQESKHRETVYLLLKQEKNALNAKK